MSFSISGKSVIVTGAANGIGLAIARQFADKGANVMCADIDEKAQPFIYFLKDALGDLFVLGAQLRIERAKPFGGL